MIKEVYKIEKKDLGPYIKKLVKTYFAKLLKHKYNDDKLKLNLQVNYCHNPAVSKLIKTKSINISKRRSRTPSPCLNGRHFSNTILYTTNLTKKMLQK